MMFSCKLLIFDSVYLYVPIFCECVGVYFLKQNFRRRRHHLHFCLNFWLSQNWQCSVYLCIIITYFPVISLLKVCKCVCVCVITTVSWSSRCVSRLTHTQRSVLFYTLNSFYVTFVNEKLPQRVHIHTIKFVYENKHMTTNTQIPHRR